MNIAIIDASKRNREELSKLVTTAGCTVMYTDKNADTLVSSNAEQVDLVLLNTSFIAHCEGQLLNSIKALQQDVYLPIILIADGRDSNALLKHLPLGADDFHTKPFDARILEAKLKAHLRTRELSQVLVEKNRKLAWHSQIMQQEQSIVQNIFNNALSRNLLNYANIEAFLLPHSRFNGDIYLIARGPIGNLYVMLGDFTGHGLAAAIGTLPTSQTFFALAAQGASISQIASEINRQLQKLLPESMFCCATLLELSASGERVTWWSGGMPPAILVSPNHKTIEHLQPQHMPLGILNELEFEDAISLTRVPLGSELLLYTDGAIEIGVQEGSALGYKGFEELCYSVDWNFNQLTKLLAKQIELRGIDDDLSLVQLHCVATGFEQESNNEDLSKLPFTITSCLGAQEIRGIDPVAQLLRGLSQMEGFKHFKAPLYTVLSEAYNNAVDHGLLRMSSTLKASEDGFDKYYHERNKRLMRLQRGHIEISLRYEPKNALLHILVRDSGPGFATVAEDNDTFPFGRGLMLIRELTERLSWSDNGRCIEFSFSLQHRY